MEFSFLVNSLSFRGCLWESERYYLCPDTPDMYEKILLDIYKCGGVEQERGKDKFKRGLF